MLRNQQFVRMFNPEHLYADECGSDHDRVLGIRRNRIRSQKPRQPLSLFATECDIPTDLFGGAAGFTAAENVPLTGPLELQADFRSAVNPRFPQSPNCGRRECQSKLGSSVLPDAHAYLLSLVGHPSASRIISFVHPAQQMYFRGSSTQIARL